MNMSMRERKVQKGIKKEKTAAAFCYKLAPAKQNKINLRRVLYSPSLAKRREAATAGRNGGTRWHCLSWFLSASSSLPPSFAW